MRRATVTQLVDFAKCEKLAVLKLTQKESINESRRKSIDAGVAEHNRLERQTVVDGRCFVASYAFGIDAAETNELRVHRDKAWLSKPAGRLGIRLYYWASPLAVGLFRRVPGGLWLARLIVTAYIKTMRKGPP